MTQNFSIFSTVVCLVGIFTAAIPSVAILSSAKLRSKPMFQTLANLSLHETCLFVIGSVNSLLNCLHVSRSQLLCSITNSVAMSAVVTSSFSLATLSIERFISVMHGLRYFQLLDDSKRRCLLASPWILFVLCSVGGTVEMLRSSDWKTYRGHCVMLDVTPHHMITIGFLAVFFIHILLMIMNCFVALAAKKHSSNSRKNRHIMGSTEDLNPMRSFWGILKATLVILMCIFPGSALMVVHSFFNDVPRQWREVGMFLALPAFWVDGWIFGFFNDELKKRYREIFCCPVFKSRITPKVQFVRVMQVMPRSLENLDQNSAGVVNIAMTNVTMPPVDIQVRC